MGLFTHQSACIGLFTQEYLLVCSPTTVCMGLFTHQSACIGLFTQEYLLVCSPTTVCMGLFTHQSACIGLFTQEYWPVHPRVFARLFTHNSVYGTVHLRVFARLFTHNSVYGTVHPPDACSGLYHPRVFARLFTHNCSPTQQCVWVFTHHECMHWSSPKSICWSVHPQQCVWDCSPTRVHA